MIACQDCNDTGSMSKTLHGPLDCAECIAAQRRVDLARMVERSGEYGEALLWLVFLDGFRKGQQCQN